MMRICLPAWLVVVLPLAACNDPASDIGSDLLGGDLTPEVRPLSPVVFESAPYTDITGQAPRVLTGVVDDPLFGGVAATAHVDFAVGYTDAAPALTGASLYLRRSYIYGDTTSMLTVAVHDILDDWTGTGSKADTMLSLGTEVTTHSFPSNDTLVVVPLPMTWVEAYEDTLRNSNADSLFHGLALAPVAGQAVVGFINTGTSLHLHAADDTTEFESSRYLTATSRTSDPILPASRAGMQDGIGPGVRIEFDLKELEEQPINGAVFYVHADTLAMQEVPADFVRPMIEELQLVAVRDESSPAVFVGQAKMTEEGIFSFRGADMASFFYRSLLGFEEYQYLELRVPVLDNSMNGLLLYDLSSTENAPQLRLILGT